MGKHLWWVMDKGKDLNAGSFYWVLPVLDPDADNEWENKLQPGRYEGNGRWTYLGVEGSSDWPARMVGDEIKENVTEEFRLGEVFCGKVVGIVVFKGRIVVALENGVFVQGDDDVFRKMEFEDCA